MPSKPRARAFGYRAALRWLAHNDDCAWLEDGDDISGSVTAAFVADCYAKTDSQIREDLRRTIARMNKESDNAN